MNKDAKETQDTNTEELPELKTGLSKVSRTPAQNKMMIGLAVVVGVFICYFVLVKMRAPVKDTHKQVNEQTELAKKDLSNVPVVRPDNADDLQMPSIPKLPDPPALVAPTPPPAPAAPLPPAPVVAKIDVPALPVVASLPSLSTIDPNQKSAADARRKSSIMLIGGGGGSSSSSGSATAASGGSSADKTSSSTTENVSANINYKPALSAANKVTTLGNLSYTIAQGKIIDTVLETSINTDLPGVVRGIVSRDVYAESGKNILIAKGSRLIGSYSASIKMGQSRVSITWDRIIRPDGIDLKIDSAGIDKLGHAGVEGMVDNKYFDVLSNALLLSVINVGLAAGTQKLTNAQTPSTTNVSGAAGTTTTTTSGSPTDLAVQNAVTSMSATTSSLLQNSLQIQPSIVIDQGTIVKVLVNQDVIFPSDIATGMVLVK
ncbi:Type IV secretion system protein PtlG [Candidatus Arcanobacter lacustris]|jgi:type IV secretion system protein VirB10|uniref:Type IV secretion system protein PtlG n=1 Tax=Candidatus Arcanibacter lacustris TaxID=1607817 RepID=A0A0F5MPH3_9RICK|nr:Type IV secretion system protein PtlG [Candidatus Arcanobacter lacustris]